MKRGRSFGLKNKKGIELAISTIILLVIGIFVLVGLILLVSGQWRNFMDTIKQFWISDVELTRKACELACSTSRAYDFCCIERKATFNEIKENITCQDSRLGIECDKVSCQGMC